jgi:hypothetical protein
MHTIATLEVHRKRSFEAAVTKSPNSEISRFESDIQNTPKRLAHFFALRHSDDFRYCTPLRKWLYWDATAKLWRACRNSEHVEAAESLCEEAEMILLGRGTVNTKAMVREVLRLAEFEPLMTRRVKGEIEPLARGLQ